MKGRFIEITNKTIKVYDADTNIKEMFKEALINFSYAFIANISTPFIVMKYDLGVLFSFMIYYFFLSYILNRDKYETKLGRYVLLPLPCIIGAFLSYKVGFWIKLLLI